jgi:hypothetical protein
VIELKMRRPTRGSAQKTGTSETDLDTEVQSYHEVDQDTDDEVQFSTMGTQQRTGSQRLLHPKRLVKRNV